MCNSNKSCNKSIILNMHIHLLPRQGVHRNLKSPRAKKKVFQYVSKRQKTESGAEKAALVKELTSLTSDGGVLDGGDHKDSYNCKLLQKITKKEQKKEDAKKAEKVKDTKKWLGIQKMIATKKKKKTEAAMEASAAASSSGEPGCT